MSIMLKMESLLPRRLSASVQKKLGYSGDSHEVRRKVGFIASFPFIVGILTALASIIFYNTTESIVFIAGYFIGVFLTFAGLYLLIDFQSMKRSKKIDDNLPDALELVSVNINSGLTIESSLIQAARPEFGELAAFLRRAAKEIYSGSPLEKAFKEIGSKIESEALQRSVLLINEGMKKGASIGDLLLRISNDLRNESSLKKEINSNISMYIMLILIATCLGAPLLFGAGTVVSLAFSNQSKTIAISDYSNSMPLFNLIMKSNDSTNKFGVNDLETVSIVALFLTCLFASMIIGVIRYNRETVGLRYLPALLIITLIIYYTSTVLLKKIVFGI